MHQHQAISGRWYAESVIRIVFRDVWIARAARELSTFVNTTAGKSVNRLVIWRSLQGWCRLNHVDAAIPNRSARLTLPLVHLFCSLIFGLRSR